VEPLHIYNYTYNVEDTSWIPVGTLLILKEPYLQYVSPDGAAALRVDSPSDLIFVDPTDRNLLESIGAEKW
jgi:hypothetical protein